MFAQEILLHIISFLPEPFDVGRLSRVSKEWRNAATDASSWKRICQAYECWPDDNSATSSPAMTHQQQPSGRMESESNGEGNDLKQENGSSASTSLMTESTTTETTLASSALNTGSIPTTPSKATTSLPASHPMHIFRIHAQTYKNLLQTYIQIRRISRRLNAILPSLPALNKLRPPSKDLSKHPIFRPDLTNVDFRQWFPDAKHCSDQEKALAMFYHLFSTGQINLNSRSGVHDEGTGLFGSFRCYGQLYSMFMLPRSHLMQVLLTDGGGGRRGSQGGRGDDVAVVLFGESTFMEFLGLVVSVEPTQPSVAASATVSSTVKNGSSQNSLASRVGHVIRFGQRHQEDRMGPIPKRALPFVDLGPFEVWLERFVEEAEGIARAPVYKRLGATSAFASGGPGTAAEVTNGILLSISTIFLLETAKVCYRISMTYLDGQCPYPSVQLLGREWTFNYLSGMEESMSGQGVIGANPILTASNPYFQYCSYTMGGQVMYLNTPLEDPLVSMEGGLWFKPTDSWDTSLHFRVKVPKVVFVRPEYI
ncbi:hypothetical protein HDU97_006378 [Phlyctochytrium planicorne]|nr:hypothetical protein HDU97_006378 [Phlyctochytrium planicorne]